MRPGLRPGDPVSGLLGRLSAAPLPGARGLAAPDVDLLDRHTDVVAAAARDHKVIRLAAAALASLDLGADPAARPAAGLRDELRRLVSARASLDRAVAPVVREALAAAARHGAGVIKGRATDRFYPVPGLRHVGDLDLHVQSWDAAVPLLSDLRGLGWEWDCAELPWLKWLGGRPYGQWALVVRHAGRPVLRLDLHVGPYSVGYRGVVPRLDTEPAEVDGVAAVAATAETTLVLLAVHAAGDARLSLKDVHDCACVLQAGEVDWARVRDAAARAGTEDVLDQLLAAVAVLYELDSVPTYRPRSRPLPLRAGSPRSRAAYIARLAFRQQPGPPWSRLSTAAGAYRAYTRDLSIRPGRGRGPVAPARQRDRNPRTCWRFVPEQVWRRLPPGDVDGHPGQGVELAHDLWLVTAPTAAAARLDRDVFVPTVDGRLGAPSLALAARLAAPRR
jgi:hypothetical protein